jgi:hypothetical protein
MERNEEKGGIVETHSVNLVNSVCADRRRPPRRRIEILHG